MKKQVLLSLILLILTQQTKPGYTGGALAGAAIGGLAGGFILGKLIGRHDKDPAYYEHKEKQELKKEAEKQKKAHRIKIKEHQKTLDRLEKHNKHDSKAAQAHRDAIQEEETSIVSIDQDIRNYFKKDNKTE